MKDIYYLFLLVITAVGSSIMTSYAPRMVVQIKQYFTRKKHTPKSNNTAYKALIDRIDDLQNQINNLAEVKYNRDKNRKHNIRRDVREYLQELAETKKEIK